MMKNKFAIILFLILISSRPTNGSQIELELIEKIFSINAQEEFPYYTEEMNNIKHKPNVPDFWLSSYLHWEQYPIKREIIKVEAIYTIDQNGHKVYAPWILKYRENVNKCIKNSLSHAEVIKEVLSKLVEKEFEENFDDDFEEGIEEELRKIIEEFLIEVPKKDLKKIYDTELTEKEEITLMKKAFDFCTQKADSNRINVYDFMGKDFMFELKELPKLTNTLPPYETINNPTEDLILEKKRHAADRDIETDFQRKSKILKIMKKQKEECKNQSEDPIHLTPEKGLERFISCQKGLFEFVTVPSSNNN